MYFHVCLSMDQVIYHINCNTGNVCFYTLHWVTPKVIILWYFGAKQHLASILDLKKNYTETPSKCFIKIFSCIVMLHMNMYFHVCVSMDLKKTQECCIAVLLMLFHHDTLATINLIFIDREAREIMYLVVSVLLSVRQSVRPSVCGHSRVFVCVSRISRRMRIIARMRSIGL